MNISCHENIRIIIQSLVSSIQPLDNLEIEHIQFTLSWIQSGADLFRTEKPAKPDPHLVSYFVIIDPEVEKILLVDIGQGELWLPTGGHVELNEHPKDTVIREAYEEIGIKTNFLSDEPLFLAVTESIWFTARHTDISLWYLLSADSKSEINFDKKEIKKIHWFDFDRIPYHYSDPHLKRFITKIKNRFSTFVVTKNSNINSKSLINNHFRDVTEMII